MMHNSQNQVKQSEGFRSQAHGVHIDIIGKSFKVAFPLHRFITDKSLGIPNLQSVQVTVASTKVPRQVAVSIHALIHSQSIQTKALGHNAYSATIAAFKKLRTQVSKYHSKISGGKKQKTSLSENEQKILNQGRKTSRPKIFRKEI